MEERVPTFDEVLSPHLPVFREEHRRLMADVRVVLVEPRRPGNIGSVARAVNVTGVGELCLVNPVAWRDTDEARMLAHGSHHILERIVETESLDQALDGVTTVIGTTHRKGRSRGPMMPPRMMADQMVHLLHQGKVAILFGREDQGLYNDEVARCHMAVNVTTATDYPSINLSHAVMVILYETLCGVLANAGGTHDRGCPDYSAVTALADRMAELALRSGIRPLRGRIGMERSLRNLLQRDGITTADMSLLHQFCAQFERYMGGMERGLPPDEARTASLDR
jgi:TrmH family RNA methyltransferase